MPYFRTTTFAAPGLSLIASAIIVVFGMWWLSRAEAVARKAGEGYAGEAATAPVVSDMVRERAAPAGNFDPAELPHGKPAESGPPFALAVLPLVVVIVTNFLMSLVVFPRLDFSFLAKYQWGGTTIGAVSGVWLMIASLVGIGAVVASLPAFAAVRDAVFSIQGGPLISLAAAMNVLAGLTGTASGGMAIVRNAFGDQFTRLATEYHISSN